MRKLSPEQLAQGAKERGEFLDYWPRRERRLREQEERYERRRQLMRRVFPPLHLLGR